jgi:hypothetical protein
MGTEIVTERLRMRPLTTDDAEAIFHIRSHKLVHKQM